MTRAIMNGCNGRWDSVSQESVRRTRISRLLQELILMMESKMIIRYCQSERVYGGCGCNH